MTEQIEKIIDENCEEDYEEILQGASWDVYIQFSSMRESILNWYPFKENSNILLLSYGYGALIGLLCRKGGMVTVLEESSRRSGYIQKRYRGQEKLSVLTGGIEALEGKKFDYIFAEPPVYSEDSLRKLLKKADFFLREDGKLLFVCENRFGMKYWCGVPDAVSGIPFAGVRGAEGSALLTRSDLIELLNENRWIKGWKLYYPFPDAILTQAVYTDEYLPKKSIKDRVIPYYLPEQKKSLVCLESEISDKIIENKMLQFFSNSFLVECGKEASSSDVIFAALSTDRGKEHGFATIMKSNGIVEKRILFPEGKRSLDNIYRNQQELLQRGIPCIDAELKNEAIEMPIVHDQELINYLKEVFPSGREALDMIFDRLYDLILSSSDAVAFSECRFHGDALTKENAGKVLEKAYIDMIPYNCFWKNGDIVFYDQEFVKEKYPAKYVMFRALRYTYVYITEAEEIVPLQYFKNRYGLDELWEDFEREEALFIENNRNYKQNSSFYQWADVQKDEVLTNARKLRRNIGEDRENNREKVYRFAKKKYDIELYKRDYRLNAIKAVQLRLLAEFVRVCNENNLAYCAIYGTLLGCIRHAGYVPWDDDLDVAMPRKDYDILIRLAPEAFKGQYFLQTPENDPGCFYGGYSKLRDENTTGLETRNEGNKCHQGIWIDIFPLDDVPEKPEEKSRQMKQVRYYQRLLLKKTYPEKRMIWDICEQEEEEYVRLGEIFSREELYARLHDTLANKKNGSSESIAVMTRYLPFSAYKEYPKTDFEFLIEKQFEDTKIYVPSGYENYLRTEYGEDYLIYPAAKERVPHHRAVFDTERSYKEYL